MWATKMSATTLKNYIVGCCIILLYFPAFSANADQITLKNQDTISGKILSKEGKKLVISTVYGGNITVSWDNIDSLYTDENITVLLKNETVLKGKILQSAPGKVLIGESIVPIQLVDIDYINPPAYLANGETLWKGHINTSFSVSDGNTNSENLNGDIELSARTKKNRFTIGSIYNRSEDAGDTTDANILGYGKYDYFFTKKLYSLINLSLEKNRFKDLNLRTTAGAGIGYQVFESSPKNLSFETGINYIKEDFKVANDNESPAFRWAVFYDVYLLPDTLQLFHDHVIFVNLDYGENILIRSRTGLKVPATKKLYISIQVNFDWDNTPPENKERKDTTYIVGLGWTL